jgi:hypothetical protein
VVGAQEEVVEWLRWTAPTRCPRIPRVAAIRRPGPRSRGASWNSPQVPSSDLSPQSPHSLKLPFDLISNDLPGIRRAYGLKPALSKCRNSRTRAMRSSFRFDTHCVVDPTPRRDTSSAQQALSWHCPNHARGSDLQPTPPAGGGTRRCPLRCQTLRSRTGVSRAQTEAFGNVSAAIDGASHLARGAVGAPF